LSVRLYPIKRGHAPTVSHQSIGEVEASTTRTGWLPVASPSPNCTSAHSVGQTLNRLTQPPFFGKTLTPNRTRTTATDMATLTSTPVTPGYSEHSLLTVLCLRPLSQQNQVAGQEHSCERHHDSKRRGKVAATANKGVGVQLADHPQVVQAG
jgi:hypothetical protein